MLPDEDAKTLTDSQFEISLGKVGSGSTVFGRYRLDKELGRGGMGVVWMAFDTKVDVTVALKFLPDVVARDSESVDELKRELRRGLSLTHPGIVRVYSFEQDPTGAAIAMEYVDGPTLSSLKLKQPGNCFDTDDLMPYLDQVCTALDYAHSEAKIVHRDLKPRNLMLTTKGRIKIADFGVATSISETVSRASIRKDGSGTPPYMSPQQAFGDDPSPSDDIYSLGATLYELLTGRPPFYQGNILAQVQQRVPPAMTERRSVLKIIGKKPIPPHWEKTIAACLAKKTEDRPQTAGEVSECLRGLRPAPEGVHTREMPINPVVTLDTPPSHGSHSATVGGAEDEEATVRGTPMARPAAPRTNTLQPSPSSNQILPIVALVTVVAVGGALWWWQNDRDEQDRRAREARAAANSPKVETAVAVPQPAATSPKPESDAEAMALKADFQRIAEGAFPRRGAPWTNELQMTFIPIPETKVLFGVHEAKMIDYRTFASETKRAWTPPEFIQGDDHPAVNVTWDDAAAFCTWLTERERAAGRLGSRQQYRLATDIEWSAAAGLSNEEGITPQERDGQIPGRYGWESSLPPENAGNFAGEGETSLDTQLLGYRDGYTHTAPVGKFTPNAIGIHDLPGNVAEWVDDWYDAAKSERAVRGAAWIYLAKHDLLTSFRWHLKPSEFADYIGFRIVLDVGPMPGVLPPLTAPAAPAPQ